MASSVAAMDALALISKSSLPLSDSLGSSLLAGGDSLSLSNASRSGSCKGLLGDGDQRLGWELSSQVGGAQGSWWSWGAGFKKEE